MRPWGTIVGPALAVLVLAAPLASAALAQRHEAIFPMAQGFEDRLTIVSGKAEFDAEKVGASTAFFRAGRVQIDGLTRVCWSAVGDLAPQCAPGPLSLVSPEGSSFGINAPSPFSVQATAAHALTTFVDLSAADGFNDRLKVGPSAIVSMVGSEVHVGGIPEFPNGTTGALTTLEKGSVLQVVGPGGVVLHTMNFDDAPLIVEGRPVIAADFSALVMVLPFEEGASAHFTRAATADAVEGLSGNRVRLLDQILHDVRFLGPQAKSSPQAILAKAGGILSEVFNGAFIRTRLSDNPNSLADVAFARFTDLTITGGAGSMDFDGSYTLVVGDLGPAFKDSKVAGGSLPIRWWVWLLLGLAVLVTGAYLWLHDGPLPAVASGRLSLAARLCTGVGAVALFLVWDWRLHQVLGSSLMSTGAHGASLGLLASLELASLLLALALIGVPVFLVARHGLALARQVRWTAFSPTAAVAGTLALGILILPALVAFLINVGIGA